MVYPGPTERIGLGGDTMTMHVRCLGLRGRAVVSQGFRPFFLAGAVYAVVLVAVWLTWVLGTATVPSGLPPIAWHAHELLFGYGFAALAGFLLTAIPSWTDRRPIVGWPLAGLFALWMVGRIAVAGSGWIDPVTTSLVTLAFPLALIAVATREIVGARNWRNLKVVGAVTVLATAQALFHDEMARDGWPTLGLPLATAAFIWLILIIGGRIVPGFTTSYLRRTDPGRAPFAADWVDRWAMVSATGALVAWVAWPVLPTASDPVIGALLIAAGGLTLARQVRWAPHRTLGEPLVWGVHAGFAFVPAGFLLTGVAALASDPILAAAAVHAWTVGAIGLSTLAVMTRASRAHTGRPLTAGWGTATIYLAITVAAGARIVAIFLPDLTTALAVVAGIAWVGAFLGFVVGYGPMLLAKRGPP